MKKKTISKIKTGALRRSFSLAKLSLKSASSAAKFVLGPNSQDESLAERILGDQAEALRDELGELKGSLQKMGQMLSVLGESFLPKEATRVLASLQKDSPFLEWDQIEKVAKQALGEDFDRLEIDPEPRAAASLAQVHFARLKDSGESLALKIQYPGVREAIDGDLRVLSSVLRILKLVPKDFDTKPLLEEVKEMLYQEADYEKERQLLKEYGAHVDRLEVYRVPKLYEAFCRKNLLAMEWLPGEDLDTLTLSEEERNRLGKAFFELYLKEFFEWGMVQTDPHQGNYAIDTSSNQLKWILFDFGAVRRFSSEFQKGYARLAKASITLNRKGLRDAGENLSILAPGDEEKIIGAFEGLMFEAAEPFLEPDRNPSPFMDASGVYDYSASDLPKRSVKSGSVFARTVGFRTPPREFVFLDRKVAGVYMMLKKLGVKLNARDALLEACSSRA